MDKDNAFDPDLIHAIFKLVWRRRALEKERSESGDETMEVEGVVSAGPSKRNRSTSANANALKLSCELLKIFIEEAVQRAAAIAEAEGLSKIEPTHFERILPQLLLDF